MSQKKKKKKKAYLFHHEAGSNTQHIFTMRLAVTHMISFSPYKKYKIK